MTFTEITKATIIYLDTKLNSSKDFYSQFNEVIDENLNASLLTYDGIMDDVDKAIRECGFDEDDFGDYPNLKLKQFYNDILTQVL
jgi:hypothetical protein